MTTYKMYDGNVLLEFDPSKHVYMHNGIVVPNVTTVTGVINKPALIPWAVNATIEWIEDQFLPQVEYKGSEVIGIVKNSKNARFRLSKEAQDIGSTVHDWIELYIRHKMLKTKFPEIPKTDEVVACIDSFLNWEKAHDIEWLETERKVFSRVYNYAGTMDILAVVDGDLSVIDAKTSKAIYDDYYLQVSAYAKAYSEEFRTRVDRIGVLRVPKLPDDKVEYASTDKINDIFNVFLNALMIWRFKQEFNQ